MKFLYVHFVAMVLAGSAMGQTAGILGLNTLATKPEYIAVTSTKSRDYKITYASLLGGMVTDVIISNDSLFQVKNGVRGFVGKVVSPAVNVVISAGVSLSGKGTKLDPFVISALNAPTVPTAGPVDLTAVYARMDAMQRQLDSVARIQTVIPLGKGLAAPNNVLQINETQFATGVIK